MNGQITSYLTITDFVEMVRKKFDSEKPEAESRAEKVKELKASQAETSATHQRQQHHAEKNDHYGVDITV
ncbi:MAG: hypothetical protein ACD_73C00763G0002 [uncultured bacterium]|nr:MAG: hypothetical protein ACD_73C00763G0002 [uncultured bacterium]